MSSFLRHLAGKRTGPFSTVRTEHVFLNLFRSFPEYKLTANTEYEQPNVQNNQT